jgi:hypothetical protein
MAAGFIDDVAGANRLALLERRPPIILPLIMNFFVRWPIQRIFCFEMFHSCALLKEAQAKPETSFAL